MNDDSTREMLESFRKSEESRKRYQYMRNNPRCIEAKLARLFMFLFTTLFVGSLFMGLFYLAYLVEGGWWWWIKYYSYGTGAIIGCKLSRHEEVFP